MQNIENMLVWSGYLGKIDKQISINFYNKGATILFCIQ